MQFVGKNVDEVVARNWANDLREKEKMARALNRVARLNPNVGEIGEGMLNTIVQEARAALAKATGEQ